MKTAEPPVAIKREVGERVDVMCSLDPTTVKDLGNGVFEATVTTAEKDRTMESIDTSGLDASTWEKTGMPVLYGHDYSSLPIGKGLSYKMYKTKMTARFQLAVDILPFAATVAELIKGGYLNSVSIGGVVRQWSPDYMTIEEMEMVEFSVVPIPANASALITARDLKKATGKSMAQVRKEFQEAAQKVLIDNLSDLSDNDLNQSISTLQKLLDALEAAAKANATGKTQPKEIQRTLHISLRDTAKLVNTQSQTVIKLIKLEGK